jgi:V8-like Glu-specific endopeptidase
MVDIRFFIITILLICEPVVLIAQGQITGQGEITGQGVIGGNGSSGTWSDIPRKIVLTVGIKIKDQSGEHFQSGGAAVLVSDAAHRTFIATALHVFDNPEKHWAPDTLQIRGWKDEGKSRYIDFGETLQVRKDGKPLSTASKQFDLAIIPAPSAIIRSVQADPENGRKQFFAPGPQELGGDEDVYDGADVFILGFPALVGTQYQQHALMRSGIIAWTNTTGPTKHEFLVDARIFPGNSGGPVFSSAAGMTRDAGLRTGKPIKLLGIVSQTINAQPELVLGMRLPNEAMVVGAAGVGVIEPAQALIDLMAQVP